jgi:peptidylprolyl isomerase
MKYSLFLVILLSACASAVTSPPPARVPVQAPAEVPTPLAPAPPLNAAAADAANWRPVDPQNLIIFDTSKGRILIEAFPQGAPKHVAQYTQIIRSGDLDGTSFHRVIDDFMAQGGDIFALKGRESGLPDLAGEFTFRRNPASFALDAPIGVSDSATTGYVSGFPLATQKAFFAGMSKDGLVESWMPHCRGVVSAARTSDPNSANSQFFLMREHTPFLDKEYTAWGRVIAGEAVVKAIKYGPKSQNGTVAAPDILRSAKIAADLPAATRPRAWVMRTDTDGFRTSLAAQGDVHVCALASVQAITEN